MFGSVRYSDADGRNTLGEADVHARPRLGRQDDVEIRRVVETVEWNELSELIDERQLAAEIEPAEDKAEVRLAIARSREGNRAELQCD